MSQVGDGVMRGMAKGAAWMIGLRFAIRGFGLINTIILARLLMPADFGLVALAVMIVAGLEAFSEFNFDTVLIQRQDADRGYYDTVWTLSVLRGGALGIVLAATAPAVSSFFDEPRLEAILYVLAILSLADGLQNVGVVDFRKHLQFGKDFTFMFWPRVAGYAATIGLAFATRSYWALIAGAACERVFKILASYWLHRFRPRLQLAHWREIFGFSVWLFFNNVINFINVRADTFVIGKLIGAQGLGFYTVAYDVANLATTELVAPIRRAIFPGYSKLAGDLAALRKAYLDVWALTLAIAAPIAAGIGLIADPMVRLALGTKWATTIELIQVLTVYGLISVATSNVAPMLYALGKPRLVTWIQLMAVAVALPALIAGAHYLGLIGVALAITATNLMSLGVSLHHCMRELGVRSAELLRSIWRTAISVTVLCGVALALYRLLPDATDTVGAVVALATVVPAGALAYIATHLCLWRICGKPDGAERHVIGMIEILRASRARPSSRPQ